VCECAAAVGTANTQKLLASAETQKFFEVEVKKDKTTKQLFKFFIVYGPESPAQCSCLLTKKNLPLQRPVKMDTSMNGGSSNNGGHYAPLEEGSTHSASAAAVSVDPNNTTGAGRSSSKYNESVVNSVDEYNHSFIRKSGRFATGFLIGYFVISIIVSNVWFGFKPLDAIYFSVVTFSTVGYGDFVPKSTSTRLFQAFLIIFGVGVGSSLIGILNDHINTYNENTSERRSIETTEKLQQLAASGVDLAKRKYRHIRSGISSLHIRQAVDDEENVVSDNGHSPQSRTTSIASTMMADITIEQLATILRTQYEEEFKQLNNSVVINFGVVVALIAIGALGMGLVSVVANSTVSYLL
jgi:hypothetical protein